MRSKPPIATPAYDPEQESQAVEFEFGVSRRAIVQLLGAGLLITVGPAWTLGQARPGRGGRPGGRGGASSVPRVHIARDGLVTVMTGKVEGGQGARAELTQAAAEELRVPVARLNLVMGDTQVVPDDGITAGSRSTPSTVPAIRQAAAAAREALIDLAAKRWAVVRGTVALREGTFSCAAKGEMTLAQLASADDLGKLLAQPQAGNATITPVEQWKILGNSVPRPNGRDLVTGAHRYPSDTTLPGMLYGAVLRPPAYGAKLTAIDAAAAKAMKDVVVVQDGAFVGVAAPTLAMAQDALALLARSATWETAPHPSSKELFKHLASRIRGGLPRNPFADDAAKAAKSLKQEYHVAYVQHTPMEPRAALAQWDEGKLTVWAGTQNPFGHQGELARAFGLGNDRVRVIVPDFGGGFGGKHTAEAAIEAARLARGAGRPVMLRWTRQEEFTWAYFRPAAVIGIEAALDMQGAMAAWHMVNVNSGQAALETPYKAGKARSQYVQSDPPLRQGSYRALASTANNFARECFMDELAHLAGRDALEFRLAHLENPRLRAVLETAAAKFGWAQRGGRDKRDNVGVGLACGTEKGSYIATCVEVAIENHKILVRHVCAAFECGAILNPDNLLAQVQGCLIMGLGPALREETRFENGIVSTASFASYLVPRFEDVPPLDIHLLNRPDLSSVGAGETPIIAIAPAIANAVFRATGTRIRQMPITLPK